MSTVRKVARLTLLSVATAALAFLQSRLLVQRFGASTMLDQYYLATAIPMAIMTMVSTGGTSLLVPLLAKGRLPGRRVAASWGLLAWIVAVVAVGTLASALASVQLGFWPAIAVKGSQAWVWLIALGSAAYGLSFYPQSVLVAEERPTGYMWAQVISFGTFIAMLLSSYFGRSIWSVAIFFLAGGVAQLAVSMVLTIGGGSFKPTIVSAAQLVSRGRGGLLAVALVVSSMQMMGVIDRWFAKPFPAGFLTSYYLADRVVQMIVMTLAGAVATVLFPKLVDEGEAAGLRTGKSILLILFLLAPIAGVIAGFSNPIVRIAYGGGLFRDQEVQATARLLSYMALAILPMGLVFSLPRRVQAVGRYSVQAAVSILLLAVDVFLKALMIRTMGQAGVPLSTALAYGVAATAYLAYLFRTKLLVLPSYGLKWILVTGTTTVLTTGVAHAVFGSDAPLWVPVACYASIIALIFIAIGGQVMKEIRPGLPTLEQA